MSSATILLVEDHPLNLALFRILLEHTGHEVLEATDLNQARDHLARGVPHLALLDINVPGGGGEVLLKEMRADPRFDGVPIVAVTAMAMSGDRERLLAVGFDGYVSKPVDTRGFAALVERFLVNGRNAPQP